MSHLEIFCKSGGFDLLRLILKGGKPGGYNPSFQIFSKVLGIICNLKDFFEIDFFKNIVSDLRNLCMDYALNRIDEESLRVVDKKELGIFIH